MPYPANSTTTRHGIAVLAVAAAIGLHWALWDTLENRLPYITFYPAIMVAGYMGGTRPGILATVLSALAAAFLFLEPVWAVTIDRFVDWVGLTMFVLIGGFISMLCGSLHQAIARAAAEVAQAHAAEQSQRASEARFQLLAESLPQLVWTCRADGWCDYLSRQWCEYTGRSQEEQVGDAWLSSIHPEDRDRLHQRWQLAVGTGGGYDIDFRIRRHDGVYRWFKTRAVPVKDVEGRILKWFGSNTDFEDFKQAEHEIRRLNENLETRVAERTAELANVTSHIQAVLDAATEVSIISTDHQGLITVFNRGAERMLGYTAAEMVGRRTPELFHDATEVAAHAVTLARELGVAIAGFEVFVVHARRSGHEEREWTYIHKDGSRLTVNLVVTALRDAQGNITGYLGVARDITERKRAEEAVRLAEAQVRSSEERLRLVLDNASDALLVHGEQGRIVEINRRACENLGYSREEMIGMEVTTIDPVVTPATVAAIEAHLDAGKDYRLESMHRRKDGTLFPVEVRISPFQLNGKRMSLSLAHDITERRQTEAALRQAKEAAEHASRAKSAFLASMSHEIRTPLNGILGMTELALDTALSPQQRSLLTTVQNSAEALLLVLNDILDFSKIEAGKLALDPTDFSPHNSLAEALRPLAIRAEKKGLTLALHVKQEVPATLGADEGRIRQVLINLVGNAVKFTSRGEIVVTVKTEPIAAPLSPEGRGEQRTALDADSVQLHVTVRDTGIGISPEKLSAIFEPFAQADSSTTRHYGGTGLGLAIAARLTELLGGRLWAESAPGRGSTFHFTARCEVRHGKTLDLDGRLAGLRVLLADAHATRRTALLEMLAGWLIRADAVATPAEAAAALQAAVNAHEPYQVLLADNGVLIGDGDAALARLREEAVRLNAVLIVLASPSHTDLPPDALGHLPTLVVKPVKPADLLAALQRVLGGNQPQLRPPAQRQPARTSLRVLLAEDNAVNQEVAKEILARQGHHVTVANTGCEVLALLEQQEFDLCLMDVQMPELDGLAATAQIRAREQQRGGHLPIVALTAHALKGDRERCLAAGMDGYLTKPVRVEEIQRVLLDLDGAQLRERPQVVAEEPAAATSSPPPAAAPLNEKVLRARLGIQQGLLQKVVALFATEWPRKRAALQRAAAAAASGELAKLAHALKGTLATLGAQEALETIKHVEGLALDGTVASASTLLEQLDPQIDRLQSALTRLAKEKTL